MLQEAPMSDGPYRTLPMPKPWKTLTKCADLAGFSAENVQEAVCPALVADWQAGVPDGLIRQLRAVLDGGATGTLFPEQREQDLATLRGKAASPVAGLLIDCAVQALADGLDGGAALRAATEAALRERALAGARQVEEHYRRRVAADRTDNVRCRLEAAISAAPIGRLAGELLGEQPRAVSRTPAKRDGLDEGVPL
jgi:hypothetical protein